MKRFLGLPWAMVIVVAALLALFGVTRLFGGASSASAASVSQQIGMKVLLITDSANSNAAIAYGDWENTLQREGVPYTVCRHELLHPWDRAVAGSVIDVGRRHPGRQLRGRRRDRVRRPWA